MLQVRLHRVDKCEEGNTAEEAHTSHSESRMRELGHSLVGEPHNPARRERPRIERILSGD